ncbi:uncharacterized protein PV07_05093 [Cladophialophora immunda]|uniref:Alpha/beta hydrolase fold-3 domain-containing protein n=1 Tax=Cladophialophora immunda TaxID=569365 RepID=A0A0D2CDN5_9EURO|nr:uncharacterized protein PV07_05093 [Cladophialophora immunda]KIW29268.1 hypothetical protein PV07_05093 [Cladophialophora immunda]OQV07650.1 hypothetical protein CLAIMM_12055 [Cladophialophora immunda]
MASDLTSRYQPEFAQWFEPLKESFQGADANLHDLQLRRRTYEATIEQIISAWPEYPNVERVLYHAQAGDGHQIPVYAFVKRVRAVVAPNPSKATAGVLHIHGGGMILGTVELFTKFIARQVEETSVPFFSVEYRRAPEFGGTTLVDDCYAGLVWLRTHAAQFNIDVSRIAVVGESAGGGLAAGVALKARDQGLQPPLAKQILIYPMLDDRNIIPNPEMAPWVFYTWEENEVGWAAVLGKDKAGNPQADVSEYVAPARAKSVAGLPSTYLDVGSLDIFVTESLVYASRLMAENIEVEFHLYPGLPHGYDLFASGLEVSKRCFENRKRAIMSL